MRGWMLLSIGLLFALDLAATEARNLGDPDAEALLAAYNQRDTGATGVRRIQLDLETGGTLTRRYNIIHTWQRDEATLRSLVLLEKPDNLRGTSYLLAEDETFTGGMKVHLSLIAGNRRALEIKPGRFDEGLLGSDFSYADLLWTISLKGRRFESAGKVEIAGQAAWAVDVYPDTEEAKASTVWDVVRHYLRPDSALLVGSDYYASVDDFTAGQPSKWLRISGWRQQDGVWTPTRMEMTLGESRKSVLTLSDSAFHLPAFDPSTFAPSSLTGHVDRLREGKVPEFLTAHVTSH